MVFLHRYGNTFGFLIQKIKYKCFKTEFKNSILWLRIRASYKNESCKDDSWFKRFPYFTWADRKITVFAILQK